MVRPSLGGGEAFRSDAHDQPLFQKGRSPNLLVRTSMSGYAIVGIRPEREVYIRPTLKASGGGRPKTFLAALLNWISR
jgi:hypothetical protein